MLLVPETHHPAHLQVLTTRSPDRKCWGGQCPWHSSDLEIVSAEVQEGMVGWGGAGEKPRLHLCSLKTQLPLLVKLQGGLSTDGVQDKRHLRRLRRPQLEIQERRTTRVTYKSWFQPRMSLPQPSPLPDFLCSYSDFLPPSSRRN